MIHREFEVRTVRREPRGRSSALRFALVGVSMVLGLLAAPVAIAGPEEGNPVLTPVDGQDVLTLVQGDPNDANFPPLPEDYRQQEYFLAGFARQYPDEGDRIPYRTRIVVRVPEVPEKFNGTVVVEWFNVSAGQDNVPNYLSSQLEVHRRGYAWVGVSAQQVGVSWLQAVNPLRYGSLNHPGDVYSFDIYSQAGHLLKNPGEDDPLAGLRGQVGNDHPLKLLATGQSQGASRLASYITTGALDDAPGIYDSLMPESGGSTLLEEENSPSVPVLQVMTESEASAPPPGGRPTASSNYRLWWVAGASHVNWWEASGVKRVPSGQTGGIAPVIADLRNDQDDGSYGERGIGGPCPKNHFPKRYAVGAGIRALDVWMRDGVAPISSSDEFEYDAEGELVRDTDSNVVGGLRLAPIEVPVATYIGNACALVGLTIPFIGLDLQSRYPTHGDYLEDLQAAIDVNLTQGYLLPEDAADLLRRADAAWFRWELPVP